MKKIYKIKIQKRQCPRQMNFRGETVKHPSEFDFRGDTHRNSILGKQKWPALFNVPIGMTFDLRGAIILTYFT